MAISYPSTHPCHTIHGNLCQLLTFVDMKVCVQSGWWYIISSHEICASYCSYTYNTFPISLHVMNMNTSQISNLYRWCYMILCLIGVWSHWWFKSSIPPGKSVPPELCRFNEWHNSWVLWVSWSPSPVARPIRHLLCHEVNSNSIRDNG